MGISENSGSEVKLKFHGRIQLETLPNDDYIGHWDLNFYTVFIIQFSFRCLIIGTKGIISDVLFLFIM